MRKIPVDRVVEAVDRSADFRRDFKPHGFLFVDGYAQLAEIVNAHG